MKKCPKCGVERPLKMYFKSNLTKDKLDSYCKICSDVKQRKRRLEKIYGITVEQYDSILKKQDGRCAICGKYEHNKRKTRLAVDHDHKTGKVRGLLCFSCNMGLGSMRDDTLLLENAIEYLKRFERGL